MGNVSNFLRDLADLIDNGCGISAEQFEKIAKEVSENTNDIEDLKAVAGMLSRRLNAIENKDRKTRIIEMKINGKK